MRALFLIALVVSALAGCIVAPAYPGSAYGYAYDPGYAYAYPYAYPTYRGYYYRHGYYYPRAYWRQAP
jgi:hypothetical protein